MSLLTAYLAKPSVQKVLNRKPGEKGFSLIELVVVVAVLAILAAIAIPSFTSINDNAAQAAAKNTLAQIAKECAVKKANGNNSATFNVPQLKSYKLDKPTPADGAAACSGDSNTLIEFKADGNAVVPQTITYKVSDGKKSCTAGTTGSFCVNTTW